MDKIPAKPPPAPIRPLRFGALFYWAALAITGGATQLAVITTPSHTILPSRSARPGKTLDTTQHAGMMNPDCRAERHPA